MKPDYKENIKSRHPHFKIGERIGRQQGTNPSASNPGDSKTGV